MREHRGAHGARAGRGQRADERAARVAGRQGLRDRGQPARLAHRAVRLEVHRALAGQDRRALPGRAKRWRRRASPKRRSRRYFNVKESVLPFNKFPGIDPILGPEMKSTGEVMGVGATFAEAFLKAQVAVGEDLPRSGVALPDQCARRRQAGHCRRGARSRRTMGFSLVATRGTARAGLQAGRDSGARS
jgi:hypothetical protein